jgi:hypothetical protein
MKKIYMISIVLLVSLISANGQGPGFSCTFNFEDNPCWEGSFLNLNVPGSNNIWQVCVPQKTVFNSAFSPTHAILTDSTGPYPVNNTSSFILKAVRIQWSESSYMIGGMYKFDSDTLKDSGRIEISLDHGATWLNILSDTATFFLQWFTPKPVFTGRIHSWRAFNAIIWNSFSIDTMYYRFTFFSDNIQTNQEGWMLDDIQVTAHIEGIQDIGSQDEINIYPNPASDRITISAKTYTGEMDVSVYDILGKPALEKTIKNKADIDISGLSKGIYMVKVIGRNKYWVRKIVKE